MLKTIISKVIPAKFRERIKDFKNLYWDSYLIKSYSQEGEDLILLRVFENKAKGFYVDVGAHHPFRFSNTYLFYRKGWWGINIDAARDSIKLFKKFRPRDINLEIAISDKNEEMTYYVFDEPALNTFDEKLAEERVRATKYKIIDKIKIRTKTLTEVLDRYMPEDQQIDFLTIDTEGSDIKVLLSLDWRRYKPDIVLIEVLNYTYLEDIYYSEIYNLMRKNGYSAFAKTFNTLFFKRTG
ncbi:MAG: FkbM family methyltransferase [Thermosphaera sp.]